MIFLPNEDSKDGTLRDLIPDLTPMLDVLFILLLFLMLSQGIIFKALDLNLPSSSNSKLKNYDNPKNIILEIHDDFYVLDEQKITEFDNLTNLIAQLNLKESDQELIIAGDKNVAIEKLLNLLTFLQSQNIKTANILMKDHE